MDEIRYKPRITITLDRVVLDKLPKRDRSYAINQILKQHYQKEGFEQMWEMIKKKILSDKDIGEWIQIEGGTKKY